ncbi:MAG: transporter substrate-binding domain-containing protein [Psychromonas sp.]|nr:transporter substrate-binding domain-containing protein [Psychromonas sp.]
MCKLFSKLFLVISSSLLTLSYACSETLEINQYSGTREEVVFKVLQLALSKSDPSVNFHQQKSRANEARTFKLVLNEKLSVMWAGFQPQYEKELLPIRIPVLKGILGHRLMMIKQGSQHRFDNIKTLADLKAFTAGTGTFWGDTKILEANHIPVIKTIKYQNLFPMLEGERFDYYPRAAHELWEELDKYSELNLTVEKNILLVYPLALYFFVAPDNQALHDKIYKGFEMAIEDGSYDKLFFNDPSIKAMIEKGNLSKRKIFHLKNPDLNPQTPINRPEFWLDVSKLK